MTFRRDVKRVLFSALTAVACLSVSSTSARADDPRQVTVVLGRAGSEPQPQTAVAADKLERPFGVDFDADGNMWIVELEGGRVHRLSAKGKFSTIAGDGSRSYRGDGGPAADATFNGMHNCAVTGGGDLYIADSWNHVVRRIDIKTGKVSTLAGTGKPGFSGDGGPAAKAQFHFIMCISLDPQEKGLYLADLRNRRIRRIDLKTGTVDTVAGNGKQGVPSEGAVATESPLVDPRAVAVDADENVYVLERGGHALRIVRPDGKIHTVAGTGKKGRRDGPALEAQLSGPKHLAVDGTGNVVIADDQNHLIRRFDPKKKTLTTILGSGQGQPAVKLKNPHGVCFDAAGVLYVVDSGNHRILKVE